MSRNQKKQNDFYPDITKAVKKMPGNFILDSELVTFKGNVTSFSRLQNRMHVENPDPDLVKRVRVYAYVFDILYFDGYLLTNLPLRGRKKVLRNFTRYKDPIRFLPHRNETGEKYFKQACKKGWEGLIAKDATSTYVNERSKKWLKFKCAHGQEFVICGYTAPQGERIGFGALLLGYYKDGDLLYAGRVGTGFDDKTLKRMHSRMTQIKRESSPFKHFEPDDEEITFITPKLVGEIGFTEWTDDGKLRHPRFLGLRKDKDAQDVHREDTQG